MDDFENGLITAERAGRALVSRLAPHPGDVWSMDVGAGADGAALLAAARLAARFGADVRINRVAPGEIDPAWATLVESARRQGLVAARPGPAPGTGVSRLAINGEPISAPAPAGPDLWKALLSRCVPFIREAGPGSPHMTCAQCREVDGRAMREFGVPGLCLMENAAIDAVMAAMDMLHDAERPGGVLVIAGGGNNGGDGLAAARGLLELGVPTKVALLKPRESLGGDAGVNLRLLAARAGSDIRDIHDRPEALAPLLDGCALAIDALLGTGFRGGLSPAFAEAIRTVNGSGKPVLSLDIPSGLDGDTGAVSETAVKADRTVTFAAVKTGLTIASGPSRCGTLYLGDIGAPAAALRSVD